MPTYFRTQLPSGHTCPTLAQQLIDTWLRTAQVSRRIVEDVTLVASELIGTASVRDDGTVELRLLVVDGDVRLEVICSREDHSDLRGHDDAASGVLARACVNKVVARWGMFAGASHVWAWVDDDS